MISSKVLEMSVYIRALEAQALCRGLSMACHFIWHVFENVSKRSLFGDIMKHFCKTWKTENDWIIVESRLEGHWTRAMLNLLLNDAVWKRWRPLVCVHGDLEQHPDLRGPFIPSQPHSWRHCSHPHAVIQPGFTVFSTILPASPTASFIMQDFRVTQSIFLPQETLRATAGLLRQALCTPHSEGMPLPHGPRSWERRTFVSVLWQQKQK